MIPQLISQIAQLTEATRQQAIATLISAIVISADRPHSIQEVLDIARDINFAINPAPNFGVYKEWEKTKDTALKTMRG
jgi:hypothetical protein